MTASRRQASRPKKKLKNYRNRDLSQLSTSELQKAMSIGFACDMPQLKDFFINYINQHK